MLSILQQIETRLVAVERIIIFSAVVLLTADLSLQVASRYALSAPLAYTIELSRVGLVWLVFVGSAHATYMSEHFAVAILIDRLRIPGKWVLEIVVDLLTVGFFSWLAYNGALLTIGNPQIYPALGISVAIAYAALPIGTAAMVFHSLMILVRLRAGYQRHLDGNADVAVELRGDE